MNSPIESARKRTRGNAGRIAEVKKRRKVEQRVSPIQTRAAAMKARDSVINKKFIAEYKLSLENEFGSQATRKAYVYLITFYNQGRRPGDEDIRIARQIAEVRHKENNLGQGADQGIEVLNDGAKLLIEEYLDFSPEAKKLSEHSQGGFFIGPEGKLKADSSVTDELILIWIKEGHLSPNCGLRELNLSRSKVTEEGVQSLFNYGCLNQVEKLNLKKISLGAKTLALMGNSADLENLRGLDLSSCGLEASGGEQIAKLKGLRVLNIAFNELGRIGAGHIAKLTELIELKIDENNLGAAGAKHIAKLSRLRDLSIRCNDIGSVGAEHLIKLRSLRSLNVRHNHLGDAGAEIIAKFTWLNHLNIRFNTLGGIGAKHIAKLTGLESLDIACNHLKDDGAEHIGKLLGLIQLDIACNMLEDTGAAHLRNLLNLKELDIGYNRLGAAGVESIKMLKGLTALDIVRNRLLAETINDIHRIFPFAVV